MYINGIRENSCLTQNDKNNGRENDIKSNHKIKQSITEKFYLLWNILG